ncbi:uncharacterized protein LOC117175064 isoform X2 [Belonocnema kinseyi]|uniref:uncharacterized protein LOC117175064 isoform X2 n=1 Tax=Belonocnema kinseyi TaxID=2817044 RepID=UPI00143CE19D|nr:uncharacterized protein LOC117175064 isoform X2 [Belonocnema kinseyi]
MPQKITPEFIQGCIKHHNDYRVSHGSPPLVEDAKVKHLSPFISKLNQFAQEWAENLAKRNIMEHRGNNPYGENIYQAYNSDPEWIMKPIDSVKVWYEEISLYKFGEEKPRNPSAVGHFTQLVWKETEKVGVGMATSAKGHVYIVCNYDPPGNVIGQFAKNVLPAKKSPKEIEIERMERERRWPEREERRKKRGDRITLTPSLEKIGIKFLPPNMEVIESMDRLIAVPSEKFRVWSCWLSMVGDEVLEWRYWLLSQINLVLRMSDIMLKTEAKGKEIKKKDVPKAEDEKKNEESIEKKVETMEHTTEINDAHQIDIQLELEEEEQLSKRKDPKLAKVEGEIKEKTLDDTHVLEELSPDTEPTSDANPVLDDREEEIDADEGSNEKATDEIEKERESDRHNGEENKEKENSWPIGLPWEPKESDKKEKRGKEMREKVKRANH